MFSFTPNQTTIVASVLGGLTGALVGGVVAIITTRYIVRHGPDYSGQINQVNETLNRRVGSVASTLQDRISEITATLSDFTSAQTLHFERQASYQQAEMARVAARSWKPEARLEVTAEDGTLSNSLVLKSTQHFSLDSVYLQTKDGATLAEIELSEGTTSTGFRLPISHAQILKVKQSENKGGLQNGARGRLTYRVVKGGENYHFELPFTTEDVMVGGTLYTKLLG